MLTDKVNGHVCQPLAIIGNNMTSFFKIERVKSPKHRKWIASLPCIISGYQGERGIDHHLMGMGGRGTALKEVDMWTVPMEFKIHNKLHRNGDEEVFFINNGLPYEHVVEIAINLALNSPDNAIRESMKLWKSN